MITMDVLIDQTLTMRQTIVKLLKSIPVEYADTIPPTWHNNARWHAGHLVVTPFLVTYGILKEPLPVPEDYRKWFAKGSSPANWTDADLQAMPQFSDLVDEIVPQMGKLFDAWRERGVDQPFLEPYPTSAGVVLHSPAESLSFSLAHDAIHLGMILALKRALQIEQ